MNRIGAKALALLAPVVFLAVRAAAQDVSTWPTAAIQDDRLINVPCKGEAKRGFFPDVKLLDKILKAHVSKSGMVDYRGVKQDDNMRAFLAQWGCFDPRSAANLPKDARTAFWINMHNAHLLAHVAKLHPISSVEDVPNFYMLRVARMGPYSVSQRHLFEEAAANAKDARILFALCDGCLGGPLLRNEIYTAEKLDAQLEEQTKKFLARPRNFRVSVKEKRVYLSRMLGREQAYIRKHGAPLGQFLARYAANEMEKAILLSGEFDFYIPTYDKGLNGEGRY